MPEIIASVIVIGLLIKLIDLFVTKTQEMQLKKMLLEWSDSIKSDNYQSALQRLLSAYIRGFDFLTKPSTRIGRKSKLLVIFSILFASVVATNIIFGIENIYTDPGTVFSAAEKSSQNVLEMAKTDIKEAVLNLDSDSLYRESLFIRMRLANSLKYPLVQYFYCTFALIANFYFCFTTFKISMWLTRLSEKSLRCGYDAFTVISHTTLILFISFLTSLLFTLFCLVVSFPSFAIIADGIIFLMSISPKVALLILGLGGLLAASIFPVWLKLILISSLIPVLVYILCAMASILMGVERLKMRSIMSSLLLFFANHKKGPVIFLWSLLLVISGILTAAVKAI